MGGLPPVFIEFIGSSKGVKTAVAEVKTELASADAAGAGAFAKTGMLGKAALAGVGLAAFEAGKHAVEAAADFQTQMTRVRTGAGEAASNMKLVSDGILAMAGQVGQSTEQLTSGLYMVESAGYHGAAALEVLKNSAMGAKVGAADLHTVTDAVTTAMNAYKMGADQSAEATNALIATEAAGKTNLEDLAGSMANILPTAAAAHVGLNEVLGAMATMTAQGTPAAVAATYLRQAVGNLSNPSGQAAQEMKSLGLSSIEVSQNLGKNGLASTLEMLTNAIQSKMGPAGTVLIEHLRAASKDTSAYQQVLANLKPDQQTYIGALADMVGGTKSMQAALELTGPHMADFKANTAAITEHVKAGGHGIEGWKDVQETFNQKMAQAKASMGAVTIQIGQYLLPVVERIAGAFATAATWVSQHALVAKILAGVIAGVLVIAIVALTVALWNMAAAALANPVVWIIIGVLALIAAIVLLIMHWRQVWDWIVGASKAVARVIAAAWHWLADETSKAWKTYIVDPIREAWREIVQLAETGYHMVVDPIAQAWRWISNVSESVWNGISGFFAKWWPLLLFIFATPIAVLMSIWAHTHKWIEDTARATWNGIKGFFSDSWKWISDQASALWSLISHYVIDPQVAMWHEIEHLWSVLMHWLGGKWDEASSTASDAWGLVRDYIIRPTRQIWDEIQRVFGAIGRFISGSFDDTIRYLGGIVDRFSSVGEDIVRGIMHGLDVGWHWLTEKVSNLANDALGVAKSALGINSPSRVFADTVGRAIPEGIALGVQTHARAALGAVTTLAGQAFGAATVPDSLTGGGLQPLAPQATGRPAQGGVTIVVNVAGSLTTQRDLEDSLRTSFLQYAGRNGTNGLALA